MNPAPLRWQTPALALANAPMGLSFTATAGDLTCWIGDSNYADNIGGTSVLITRQPVVQEIPTVGAVGLVLLTLGLGFAAFAALRRYS